MSANQKVLQDTYGVKGDAEVSVCETFHSAGLGYCRNLPVLRGGLRIFLVRETCTGLVEPNCIDQVPFQQPNKGI